MQADNQTLALSIKDAAKEVGISERFMRKMIALKKGPPLARLGSRTVIRREALAEWLKSREETANA